MAHFDGTSRDFLAPIGDATIIPRNVLPRTDLQQRDPGVNVCGYSATEAPSLLTLQESALDAFLALAIHQTDLLSDFRDVGDIPHAVVNAIACAADLWADERGQLIPPEMIAAAAVELTRQAHAMLAEIDQARADALADGIEAGDLNAAGEPIPYPQYRSC